MQGTYSRGQAQRCPGTRPQTASPQRHTQQPCIKKGFFKT